MKPIKCKWTGLDGKTCYDGWLLSIGNGEGYIVDDDGNLSRVPFGWIKIDKLTIETIKIRYHQRGE